MFEYLFLCYYYYFSFKFKLILRLKYIHSQARKRKPCGLLWYNINSIHLIYRKEKFAPRGVSEDASPEMNYSRILSDTGT